MVAFIIAFGLNIFLSSHGFLGTNFWTMFAGFVLASAIGAIVTGRISSSPWARIFYLILGTAAFCGIVILQSVMSDGHPNRLLPWLVSAHVLTAALIFVLMPGAKPNLKWRSAMIALCFLVTAGLAYALIHKATHKSQLLASARTNMQAAQSLWLPRIFTKPPMIQWEQPTAGENVYEVGGRLSNPDGTIYMMGAMDSTSCQLGVRPSHPFATYPNEDGKHYMGRLVPYLRKERCTEELIAGVKFAGETNTATGQTDGTATSTIDNVPVDPAVPSKGTHRIVVDIRAEGSSLSFASFQTHGPSKTSVLSHFPQSLQLPLTFSMRPIPCSAVDSRLQKGPSPAR
jgi:uncharacterized membrane protein YuzA (DUF378 family)